MSKRFFVEPALADGIGDELVLDDLVLDEVILDGPEAHHLIHVMRAAAGDSVILFDGTGREFVARISAIERKQVRFELIEAAHVDRELKIDLTVAVALPKADRQKVLIEKLVELGVTRAIPLITDRTVVIPKTSSVTRLERIVVEASKQCGRNQLMKIEKPVKAAELFSTDRFTGQKLIASTAEASTLQSVVGKQLSGDNESYVCAVGPEGGFTDDELTRAAENNWSAITLGKRILRAETAAIAIAAFIAVATEQ